MSPAARLWLLPDMRFMALGTCGMSSDRGEDGEEGRAILEALSRIRARAGIFLAVEVGWLLEFYVLARYKAISGWVSTCDGVRSWRLYSVVPMGDQVVLTVWSSTQLVRRKGLSA